MLYIVSINESEKWDSIVKSFENFDVYYLSGYVKGFQLHGDGVPLLIYYEDENIRGINVVMKRDISEDIYFSGKIESDTYFDLITPYGYGGFLIEGNCENLHIEKLQKEYTKFCDNQNIISEFVRFNPVLNNVEFNKGLYETIQLGETITIDLLNKEHIWSNLSSKNRNMIRKAMKSDVKIYWSRSPEILKEFIPLYNKTMDRDDAKDYYYFQEEFYKSILNDLKNNHLFFYAVYEKEIISMSIILFANNKMHYHLSASNREYQSLAATNLLLFEAACWGCEQGFHKFHLGGGLNNKKDNLYKFKKAFNKNNDTTFFVGKKIVNEKKYDFLMNVKGINKAENIMFFPKYRL